MKKKAILAVLTAAIMALSAISVFALDYAVPEDAETVTARFTVVDQNEEGNEFSMISEDESLTIFITDDTLIYFPEALPLYDVEEGEAVEMSQMVRDLLFDRTLAEVLDGRNLRVIYVESDHIEPISIMVLFEGITTGPLELTPEELAAIEGLDEADEVEGEAGLEPIVIEGEDGYQGITTLPGEILTEGGYMGIVTGPLELTPEEIAAIDWTTEEDEVEAELTLNGEIVVNGEIVESAYAPFIEDGIIMVPLRVVAEALGYEVSWNSALRSVQLGVAVQLWIGQTEAHFGRMAPIELSTAPVIVDSHTFVPLDFFRNVLSLDTYWFEGQVVIAAESDMQ